MDFPAKILDSVTDDSIWTLLATIECIATELLLRFGDSPIEAMCADRLLISTLRELGNRSSGLVIYNEIRMG